MAPAVMKMVQRKRRRERERGRGREEWGVSEVTTAVASGSHTAEPVWTPDHSTQRNYMYIYVPIYMAVE